MTEAPTFQRGIPAGVIGLVHLSVGFVGTVLAFVKVLLYGAAAPFDGGIFLGVFNYLYQFTAVLLWASGIGILRGRNWGRIVALAWALSVLFLVPVGYGLRLQALGLLAPDPGWGMPFVVGYALCVVLVGFRAQVALMAKKLANVARERMGALGATARPDEQRNAEGAGT